VLISYLKDILGRSQSVGLEARGGGDDNIEVGQGGELVAIQHRLAVGAGDELANDFEHEDDLRLRGVVAGNLRNEVNHKLAELAAATRAHSDVGADLSRVESLEKIFDDLRGILFHQLIALFVYN